MFVPSMVTDSVVALDTDSGKARWRFFTDGPVRFAPVAWEGCAYFISDDGHLYCVDAASGALRWKFRGLPLDRPDRKVIGDQRLITLTPARGGPVLHDGVIYFSAGIWPGAGIFVHALDAKTGKVVWSNTDSHRIAKANMDHGVAQYAGLTPQGYMAVIAGKLVVPCGAQLPAFIDLKTGKLAPYTMGWGGRVGLPKGSWFVSGNDRYLAHAGDLYDLEASAGDASRGRPRFMPMLFAGSFRRLQIDPTNQRALGRFRMPVVARNVMYQGDGRTIVALDLTKGQITERLRSDEPVYRKDDKFPDRIKGTFPELWRLPSKLRVHIKAGNHLYAGGPGAVEAIRIPEPGTGTTVTWKAKIAGAPQTMLAADGKLFVVTREGKLHAFGPEARTEPAIHARPRQDSAPDSESATRVAKILNQTQSKEGYALMLGIGTASSLAETLTRQSEFHVIAVEPDAAIVAQERRRFHEMGLYGTRITILPGNPRTYPFPPYFADLVVAGDPSPASEATTAARVYRTLRPYGGAACFARQDGLADALSGARLPGATVRMADGSVLLTRNGPLPGAADWSHHQATAGNAGASEDTFAKAPMALLWFDGSVRWSRLPNDAVVRVAGGRVFVRSKTLRAFDVYTGRHLWEASLPASRTRNPPLVAVEDAVYMSTGPACVVLDPATGRETKRIPFPIAQSNGSPGSWSDIRVWQDSLVGLGGQHLVCVNRRSGATNWSHEVESRRLSFAVGNGSVFCSKIPSGKKGGSDTNVWTKAFTIEGGQLLWEVPSGSALRYTETHDLLVMAGGVYRGADGALVRKGGRAWPIAGNKLVSGEKGVFTVYDLLTGNQLGKPLEWFTRGCTGQRLSATMMTTRFRGNSAYIDLGTREIAPVWGVRSACVNNLYPANGVLNMPNLTGGCECNYTPASLALVPESSL